MLSRAERRVFAAVGEAALGAPVTVAQTAGIEPLLEHMRDTDRLQLRAALHLFDRVAPLLRGRLRRFGMLPIEERERIVADWAGSRVVARRRAAAALKTLASLAHYGAGGAWPAVGYDGPWLGRVEVPVLPARALPERVEGAAAGVLVPGSGTEELRVRARACVIGTGAGGAAALARLTELGVDAVAVEAGARAGAGDFTQRVLEMLPLLYQEAGLRATRDKAIGILQGRGVGGSTLHNTGLVYEPPPGIVGRWRDDHGFELADSELDPLVRRAFDVLGAVPIPEERINRNNAVIRRGADVLGWRYRIAHHNRADCCGCGYCMLGCTYNRKNNAALTWLPAAVDGGARILARVEAERIEGSAGRRRVVCRLLDENGRPTGRRAVVEAEIVLVAAGALDTPALLQRSGIGGRGIGRGLRLHPAAVVNAIFPEEIVAWRGLPQSVILEEHASFMTTGRGGFLVIPSASSWPALAAAVLPGLGLEHRARMEALPRTASASVVLHDETRGRVWTDRRGRPVADYSPESADLAELERGVAALARLYLSAGAERVILPYAEAPAVRSEADLAAALADARAEPHRLSLNSVHPQGSCPIGANEGSGACRPDGELWRERGIFVCDTSFFPTSVGVPPQVTTMALAMAVAERAAGGSNTRRTS